MSHVLMICDFYNQSLSYQENLLERYFGKLGHRVSIVTATTTDVFEFVENRHDARRPASIERHGTTTVYRQPYAFNFVSRIRKFKGVSDLLERERPDVIFVHDIQFNLSEVSRYRQRYPGTRVVLDYHADFSNSARNWLSLAVLHKGLRRPLLHRYLSMLDAIYPVTPASQRFLNEVYGVSNDRMTLLPLGCDMDACRRIRNERRGRQLRQQYGIDAKALVIFGGGKLARPKRVERLLRAFLTLPGDSTWLIIAGDASKDDAAYLEELRGLAGSHPRIRFTGWLDQEAILAHLDLADLAVFPGSQSILWQQAIGMGKPLLIGEPKAVIGGDQEVGYLNRHANLELCIEPEGAHALLSARLSALAADRTQVEDMAAGALRTADELLDWNVIATQTLGT
ncbi:glycosyltransferase family 4 protein [Pelomonas sp. Root1237]|uniref:glycosyltransferase family 4 protein n=1 Tax=Pelomonas sp. Root1237 TaxID=1736434 RepID=UPI0006F422BC|nr:glycosyltransferase family 4 protein [Pelomonas sp. Root1237]